MANPTYIWSAEDDDPGGMANTFLLACWYLVPDFSEFDNFQVFDLITDGYGLFWVQLSWDTDGVVYLYLQITEQAGGFPYIVSGGTGNINGFNEHHYIKNGWNSFALSCRFSTQTMQYMINGNLLDPMVTWDSSNPITFPSTPGALEGWSLGPARHPPGVAMRQFRFGHGEPFFDLNLRTNRDKLYSPDNGQVYWGENGELVTGQVPQIFLHGDATQYMENPGSLGPFHISNPDVFPLTNYGGSSPTSSSIARRRRASIQRSVSMHTSAGGSVSIDVERG
jgi:hypothetical protein